MRTRRFAALALGTMAFLATAACDAGDTTVVAGDSGDSVGITVDGLGTIDAPPDTGIVDLGVATDGATVAEARERAAVAADAVIASLKGNGVEARDIQTVHFSISPVYDYSSSGQARITGYSVVNTVTAKVRDIDRLGEVIDAAAEAGGDATRVSSVRFDIDDRSQLIAQARERAMQDARTKAGQLAALAEVELGAPLSIVEASSSTPPAPVYFEDAARAAQVASTPIEIGTSIVEVRVTVRWAIET